LASSLRSLGRWEEAAAAARHRVELSLDDPAGLFDGACALAQCVPGTEARGPERRDKARDLADEAMSALRAAVASGFSDGDRLGRSPGLAPLRGRDDFQRLLLELMDRAMPADPFVR
jgi:hypothetical protein